MGNVQQLEYLYTNKELSSKQATALFVKEMLYFKIKWVSIASKDKDRKPNHISVLKDLKSLHVLRLL